MIRWSYVIPRLGLLVLVLTVAQLGLPSVIRWTTVHGLQTATGASVQVDRVWASLARGRLRVEGAQVAREPGSERNLMEFESAELTLDLGALARRRYVIDSATIRGLQLNTHRIASAAPTPRHKTTLPDDRRPATPGTTAIREWLEQAAAAMGRNVEEESESIRLVRQMADRWPAEYERLERQIRTCTESARHLSSILANRSAMSSSDVGWAELQQRWQEVSQLREELIRLRGGIEQAARQVSEDRAAIERALAADRGTLLELSLLARLDEDNLNRYFLDAELASWWRALRPWLDVARGMMAAPAANDLGQRGTTVRFTSADPQPDFLIRAARLDGRLAIGGREVDFVGAARDLCLQPDLHGRPARLQLLTREPFHATLHAEFDRRDGIPQRRLVFQCLDLPVAERKWGDEIGLAVVLAPGRFNLHADLIAAGDALQGRIVCAQEDLHLSVSTEANRDENLLVESLAKAGREVQRFELSAVVAGTLHQPTWEIHSDLGATLETCLRQHVQRAARARAEQLLDQAHQQVKLDLAQLEGQLMERQARLRQELGVGEQILAALAAPVVSRFQPVQRFLKKF